MSQEQVEAELALDLQDLLRQRGLRNMEVLGGTGEIAVIGDGDHVSQVPNLKEHALILSAEVQQQPQMSTALCVPLARRSVTVVGHEALQQMERAV
jgi:hypothetical protein